MHEETNIADVVGGGIPGGVVLGCEYASVARDKCRGDRDACSVGSVVDHVG